ncbi:MAG: hypothetical protein M1819_004435 [Sarea resinae]|nr:MAG: hypothetical protein M1819_004435 [Sarea resinae]
MSATKTTPEVLWAQRSSSTDAEKNYVYLTITAPDVPASAMKLDLKPTGLTFSGTSSTRKTEFYLELEFYDEIDVENSKTNHTSRWVELVLRKKELRESYWPRLLKESKKVHFLKTDFDKWVDEDEQDTVPEEDMNQFGGAGGPGGPGGDGGLGGIDFSKLGAGAGGMPGMGGMGGMPGMGDMGGMDLSQLGQMAGMPDLGAMGGEGSDEEDMPELEEEGDAEKAGKGEEKAAPPKIEEIS